jgi:hypothetical protein
MCLASNKLIENVFSGVSVRALREKFHSNIGDCRFTKKLVDRSNVDVKSSFSKFDALQKKNVLHVRSSDSSKAQEKFNGAQIDTSNCRACEKPVFQMEQIKAEKGVWHKNCFRCTECNKQLKSVALTLPRPNIETCSVPVSTHIRAMKAASTASPISKPYSHRKPSKTTPPRAISPTSVSKSSRVST